jgi:hypothetical protein
MTNPRLIQRSGFDWGNPVQAKAERRAMRRVKWRAFWRGVTFAGPELSTDRFWQDVERFGGRVPRPYGDWSKP